MSLDNYRYLDYNSKTAVDLVIYLAAENQRELLVLFLDMLKYSNEMTGENNVLKAELQGGEL